MSRFILPLCAACLIVPNLVGAFDETSEREESLKNATREELVEKINSLELELTKLKSEQKQRSTQQQALTNWLTYTAPLTGEVSPVPPGMFAWPSYPDPNAAGPRYPAMPNAYQEQSLDLPKGVTARPFNGVTVYNIPCVHRTVNGVPETTSRVASQPRESADLDVIRQAEAKRQLELQRFYQRKKRAQ